jgi:IS4 transposase
MRLRPSPARPDPLEQLLAAAEYRDVPLAILPHARAAPLGVVVRGILEWMFDDQVLETLLQDHAPEQYTRELTLSAVVKLLIQVSAGVRASVFAAYKADQAGDAPSITTSFQALYGKLGRVNPAVSEALVRQGADKLEPLLKTLPPAADEPVRGRRLRILDGNVLAGTDHRLGALRRWLNACLPGKSLVVYEPGLGLVTDLVLSEDAYAQERALLVRLLPRVRADDLWVADRNFCTPRFVFGVLRRQGSVLVRQHRHSLPCEPMGRWRDCGATATGAVREQRVRVADPETGEQRILRRVEVRLFDKTRDGERTIALLTDLPEEVSAAEVAEIYRGRWRIENHFQFLTESLPWRCWPATPWRRRVARCVRPTAGRRKRRRRDTTWPPRSAGTTERC